MRYLPKYCAFLRRPALVIAVGETELALDQQAGRELFVRRVSCPAAAVV